MTATEQQEKLDAFLGKVVVDSGAALNILLGYVGDKLGLYKALAEHGPLTAAGLAERTGSNERMVREWALANAAGDYLTYDPAGRTFAMTPEAVRALTDLDGTALLGGEFQAIVAVFRSVDKVVGATRTGKGLGWGDQDAELSHATERFFRPGYEANIVPNWLPSLTGVVDKLIAGATVADVGCGHGLSTVLMAKAFPNSRFWGFDFHAPSIERARKLAAEEGVADRITFEVARAEDFPGGDYDLITIYDALHDMSNPVGAAHHVRETLAADGSVMLVEPYSNDAPEENFTPVGRLYYGFSATVCTPNSLNEDGPGLGAQAGPRRTGEVFLEAGFGAVRTATGDGFNIVYEVTR